SPSASFRRPTRPRSIRATSSSSSGCPTRSRWRWTRRSTCRSTGTGPTASATTGSATSKRYSPDVTGPGVDDYLALFDAARLAAAPSEPPPPPWLSWLVVGVVVQRDRQRWHRDIVSTRLDHAADDKGDVPGMPGWTFEQHGM